MLSALLSIVPNLIGLGADWLKGRRELKQAKLDSELRVTEAITRSNVKLAEAGQMHDIDWSSTMAKASATSWKDEYWTIILSIPAIMSFIPGLAPYVYSGFESLSATPEWYQYLLTIAVGAAFGVVTWKKLQGAKQLG